MTSLAVLIPVKSAGAKSRLASVLSGGERREFQSLLLAGVLATLRRAGVLAVTYVISSDARVLELADASGARAIKEPRDQGVNSAVIRGIGASGRPEYVLILPSDLPLVHASEIRHLLSLREAGVEASIVPSFSFDGTNALMYATSTGPDLSYDNNSFWNHLNSSAQKGLRTCISTGPGLMFDVDSRVDFQRLARSRSPRPAVEFARRAIR